MEYVVYGLFDPITQELRYIGKTNDIVKRRSAHVRDKRPSYKRNWILSLANQGLKPEFRVIAGPYAEELDALREEARLIVFYLDAGCRLTNTSTTHPESGISGHKHTDETRKKMSESRKGEKHWAYGKKGAEHPAYGCAHSEESRNKTRSKLLGIKRTAETNAKNSAQQKKRFAERGHPRSVPVCTVDPATGQIIEIFADSVQASLHLGCSRRYVRMLCDSLAKSAKFGCVRYYDKTNDIPLLKKDDD